jgi:hypothetical protein
MNAAVDRRTENSARAGVRISDMAAADWPHEWLLQLGPGSMAAPELLATCAPSLASVRRRWRN